jgi:hypothetical protein
MDTQSHELIKGSCYTKADIQTFGCTYIKETSITMYYRKENYLYVFDAKPDKNLKHKLLIVDIDK